MLKINTTYLNSMNNYWFTNICKSTIGMFSPALPAGTSTFEQHRDYRYQYKCES